ncbi:helix-turn-helix domain-containing protein, partial [Roseovarius sp.]|uniref:helix-turn-helix domain-containing protein n=1 Tax=Roseovarius sp. TaxID=1486281 RepID=UPI003569ACC1
MTTDTPTILAYCAACNDDMPFSPETRTETATIRGSEVKAVVDVLICPQCGHVRDALGHDSMLAFYNAYRQQHGYLMPHEIVALRERYDLSREAFASLLGMSPASLYRYEGGGLQDKVHDIALRSCQDPS